MSNTTQKLISARELALYLGEPASSLRRLVCRGLLLPDFCTRKELLFRPERLGELESAVDRWRHEPQED